MEQRSDGVRSVHTVSVASRRWRVRAAGLLQVVIVAALLAGGTAAHAAPPVAVGARAATVGLGADLTFGLSERVHLRLAGGAASFDTTLSTSDLDYDTEADLRSALLLLDWYPTGGGFRISVGGGWNGTEAEVQAPAEDLVRDLFPELPAIFLDFGTLAGTVQGEELVPALLVGWGNPFRGGRWGVSIEVGALYQGEPEVELRYLDGEDFQLEDIPGGAPFVDALLAEQERELNEEAEDYTLLPVVSLSVSYRF